MAQKSIDTNILVYSNIFCYKYIWIFVRINIYEYIRIFVCIKISYLSHPELHASQSYIIPWTVIFLKLVIRKDHKTFFSNCLLLKIILCIKQANAISRGCLGHHRGDLKWWAIRLESFFWRQPFFLYQSSLFIVNWTKVWFVTQIYWKKFSFELWTLIPHRRSTSFFFRIFHTF